MTHARMRWTLGAALCGLCLTGCGNTKSEQRVQTPAFAPPHGNAMSSRLPAGAPAAAGATRAGATRPGAPAPATGFASTKMLEEQRLGRLTGGGGSAFGPEPTPRDSALTQAKANVPAGITADGGFGPAPLGDVNPDAPLPTAPLRSVAATPAIRDAEGPSAFAPIATSVPGDSAIRPASATAPAPAAPPPPPPVPSFDETLRLPPPISTPAPTPPPLSELKLPDLGKDLAPAPAPGGPKPPPLMPVGN